MCSTCLDVGPTLIGVLYKRATLNFGYKVGLDVGRTSPQSRSFSCIAPHWLDMFSFVADQQLFVAGGE